MHNEINFLILGGVLGYVIDYSNMIPFSAGLITGIMLMKNSSKFSSLIEKIEMKMHQFIIEKSDVVNKTNKPNDKNTNNVEEKYEKWSFLKYFFN